MTWPAARCKEV